MIARYTDDNNQEGGNSVRYLDTQVIAQGSTNANPALSTFLDKPTVAVDLNATGTTCSIPAATGTTLTLSATASSGLSVSFTLVPNGDCSLSGNTLTFLSAPLCGVVASQAGNNTYAAAPPVAQDITVNNVLPQTITFNNPGTQNASASTTMPSGVITYSPDGEAPTTVTLGNSSSAFTVPAACAWEPQTCHQLCSAGEFRSRCEHHRIVRHRARTDCTAVGSFKPAPGSRFFDNTFRHGFYTYFRRAGRQRHRLR